MSEATVEEVTQILHVQLIDEEVIVAEQDCE